MAEEKAGRKARRGSLIAAALDGLERWGNRLPDPLTLFALFAVTVLIVSWIASSLGVSALHPATGKTVAAVNLLDGQGFQNILTKAVTNFTSFAPLGTVLVAMIGVGLAEQSGLFSAALKGIVSGVPPWLLTVALVFTAVNADLAVDAGYVILVPLGALLFASVGRHPIAGLAAAFAGVSGGFSSNIFLTPIDPLLAGLTQEAARLYDPNYTVPITANYYFMIASALLQTVVGVWVTIKIVEPRLGPYSGAAKESLTALRREEKRGLWAAGFTLLGETIVLLALTLPANGLLRDAKGGLEPFYQGLVAIMSLGFFFPGIAYGFAAGTIKSDRDATRMIGDTMGTMGSYIALAFFASQFIAYFGWSNLGLITAIGGAGLLKASGLTGITLIVLFVLVCALIDLFLASASAKWAVIGPIFVPMLMILGYSPELAQGAYRIGDSFTNIITPLMPYMPLIITFARKYDPKSGLGSILALMLPYSIAFAVSWTLLLALWLLLGIPLGPGASLTYPS